MQLLSKILLPVDFSERSATAARRARMLAERFGSEVVALHVVAPPQCDFGTMEASAAMLAELYRLRSEQAAAELNAFAASGLGGLKVRTVVMEGEPADRIVESARNEQASLIIMPTHGFGPFRRFILGSNTAKVLHDADCPVWTGVHREDSPAHESAPLRRVLCAIDLGAQSSKALCWAAALARGVGASLTLAHVISTCPDVGEDSAEVDWSADFRAVAARELRRLMDFVKVEADVMVEPGEPVKVIRSAVEDLAADALVIGRGSAAGVFGRLRTNAYAIIRESPCPVVSV